MAGDKAMRTRRADGRDSGSPASPSSVTAAGPAELLRITPEAFLDALAQAYARWEAIFTAHGFAPLRAEWLAHAARLGEVIKARTGQETREGVFEAIDEQGNLILRMAQGRVAIPAAEVFF